MNKQTNVAFASQKLKQEFDSLREGKFEDKELYKFINRAIDDLKQNPLCSIKIPKKLWPEEYSKRTIFSYII